MTRTRKPQAAKAATKAATKAAARPAAAPAAPPAPDDDRDALALLRDSMLREAFSLTSDRLLELARVTRALEDHAAADVAAAQADTAPN